MNNTAIKKYSLLFLCFLLFITVQGQSLKGSFYIDGQVNFSQKEEILENNFGSSYQTQKIIGFNPNIGYGIGNNFLVGIGINFQQTKTVGSSFISKTIVDKTLLSKSIEPSIFFKCVKPIYNRLFFSLKLNLYYGKLNVEKNNLSNTAANSFFKSEIKYHGASLSPELLFLITKKIGFHANFRGFNIVKTEDFQGRFVTEYDFNLNPSNWTFGVFILLGKGSVDLQNKSTD